MPALPPTSRGYDDGEVDTLIVGGGSAGAVLANRLSARTEHRVLLLEAGPAYAAWDYPRSIASSDFVGAATGSDWGYNTEPGFIGHAIAAFRGKVLGGSSAVNAGVAMRPRPQDMRNWNLPGWSFDDLLPAMKLLEDSDSPNATLHSRGGPLPLRQLTQEDLSPMQRAFVQAAAANGLPVIEDFDGDAVNGAGPYPMNIVNGVRVNTGMAYLTNAVRARRNLTIRGNTMVDRVLFKARRTVGVRLANGGEIRAAEVILSAGTYGSAAILLRSGIGPADDLARLAIPVVTDLPVGRRLKDHPFYYNAYAAHPDRIGAQTPVVGAVVWTHSSTAKNGDEDLHISATHLFPHDQSPTGIGFVLAAGLTRPRSVGRLWLESTDPSVQPHIDLNFLADPLDRARLMEGVKLARRIGQTAPLAGLIHSELAPGAEAASDDAIQASIAATLDTYHHPVSTAPMGLAGDPAAVVDLQGRVHGLAGLRVIDASIFPDAVSTATNITTIAVAEHLAAQIEAPIA